MGTDTEVEVEFPSVNILYKVAPQMRFDSERFKKLYPDHYREFQREIKYRTMDVTAKKEPPKEAQPEQPYQQV